MGLTVLLIFKWSFLDGKSTLPPGEIAHSGLLERISAGVSLSGQSLDPRQHPFLQSRMGRRDTVSHEDDPTAIAAMVNDPASSSSGKAQAALLPEREKQDLFDLHIAQGIRDFWRRFQLPFATNSETVHLDEQVVKGVVDELMAFNGWAAAACSSLARPFAADRKDDTWSDLTDSGQLYYFALVVHSADHFLIDQVAAIVQLTKRLGAPNIFVSLIDYASTDSTPFLSDLTEMVFTLLGISFRIKRIPPMTRDPAAAYYPLEEAYTRNLAIEPLLELYHRRKVRFAKVIWLKGFTCPNDILETLRVGSVNKAAMTCSMDWKEHNGFFIYNDRWRTRDMDGNLFRGSKSTSPIDEAPPRDAASIDRYSKHLPFQVFCCESGVHIVDPSQSFYHGLSYRSSIEHGIFNISAAEDGKAPKWSEGPCMDSAQMHFCRDLWMLSAREGVKAEAKKARDKERKGMPRGLGEEMEKIVKVVAPQYAPAEKSSGGLLGFGRKKVVAVVDKVVLANDSDEDGEEWGEGDEEEDEEGDAIAEKQAETPEEAEEKKEQAMAADAAAAALPVEEQHPAHGVDAGSVDKPAPAAGNAEALLELEMQKMQQGGAKAKLKRSIFERQDQPGKPAAANPAAQVDNGAGKSRPKSVNDDADEFDSDAPPPLSHGSSRSRATRNSAFVPARIIVNPRCVTTYAGVSHTQLALDLFGGEDDDEETLISKGLAGKSLMDEEDDYLADNMDKKSFRDKYAMPQYGPAAETFVCQEMRTSGGRSAPKQQRRTGFSIARGLVEGWQPR